MKNLICLLVLLLMFSCTGKQASVENEEDYPRYDKAEAKRYAKRRADVNSAFDKTFTLELLEKEYIEANGRKFLNYTFRATNKSNKPIKAAKGKLMFCNLFDEYIKSYEHMYDEKTLAPGESITYKSGMEVSYIGDDDEIISKSLSSLKFTWICFNVLFEDDSQMERRKMLDSVE